MNRLKPIAASLAFLLAIAAAWGDNPSTNLTKSLTLQECIERSLVNNIEIKSQRINPVIGAWGVIGAQGVYDPIFAGSISYLDATYASDEPAFQGYREKQIGPISGFHTLDLTGKLPTGAIYDFSSDQFHTQTNGFAAFTGAAAGVTVTQPLLKNAGLSVNSALIRIARENQAESLQTFVQFVMTQINNVGIAYYELIYAIDNYKAAIENRALAQQLLDETRKREKVGVQSPLDVITAEAGVAENEEAVITTARAIKDNENTLKRLICREVTEFRGFSLVPVDYPIVQMIALDVDQSTRTALEMRADYQSARHILQQQNIQVQYDRNQLWPEIDLQASYGANGRGQSYGRYLDNSGESPAWMIGVTVSLPIGNRVARSAYHTAKLDADQALLSLKGIEQNIIVQVDNAVGHVETTLKSVEAARAATRLAQESLDAEKKKLLAGTSTTFLVLQQQALLATARSAEIRAFADYCESLFSLDLAEGTILRKNNIVLKE